MKHLDDLFAGFPEHLSVPQLAQLLGITTPTAYRWLQQGIVPGYRLGRAWLVLRDEVHDHIAAGANQAAARTGTEKAQDDG